MLYYCSDFFDLLSAITAPNSIPVTNAPVQALHAVNPSFALHATIMRVIIRVVNTINLIINHCILKGYRILILIPGSIVIILPLRGNGERN